MNDFFNYLKTFLPNMSAEAYLVIQGDIYDIPKYMVQKATEEEFLVIYLLNQEL